MKKLSVLFLIALLLFTGCKTDKPAIVVQPNQLPTAHIDSISATEVYTGDLVDFTGHGSDTDGEIVAYKWRSSLDGRLSDMASFSTSDLSAGEHVIYFQVQDDDSAWSDEVTAANIIVIDRSTIPPPVIEYFRADLSRIGLGDSTILSWYVTNATTVYINQGIGNVAFAGNIEVSPVLSEQFTLTAANEGYSVTSSQNIIVVPKRVGLPVVNSFAADPGQITVGDSAILSWNVFNADYVTVEPDIGAVDPVGSVLVSPDATISYTLTAYNAVGIVFNTTQLLVTTEPAGGRPDLVITDVRKVVTEDGVKVAYTVMNQGANTAPASTTKLYANDIYKAQDYMGALAPGASETRQITAWLYNPATSIVRVTVDANNNVVEDNEGNNTRQLAFPVKVVYDFIEKADDAKWRTGYPLNDIPFGKNRDEGAEEWEGFALYRLDRKLEDASGPGTYIETHPRQLFGGWIMGDYNVDYEVKPGDYFYAVVGLLEGSDAGAVSFWVYVRLHGETDWDVLVSGVDDWYDYKLRSIVAQIPPLYFGRKVDFSLRVSTNGEPLQDNAVWIESKIIR